MLGRPSSHGPTEVTEAEAARLTETYRVFLDVIGGLAGSGRGRQRVPAQEWRAEFSEMLFALGWRSGYDRVSPPPADSPTLDVLHHLAGSPRVPWAQMKGVDLAVAATARTVIRR